MPHDILDHHDCVIHQDADAEDECEQGDAIDGVAEKVEDRHGERQRHRNRQEHNARLAPPEEQRDQQRDGKCGEQQVFEQFVGLRLGRVAVVARRGHVHIVGDLHALHLIDALERRIGNVGGVGPLALGEGDGDGGILLRRLLSAGTDGGRAEEHIVGGIGGPVENLIGNIAQIHRTAMIDSNDYGLEVLPAGEQVPGVDANLAVILGEAAGLQAGVCGLQTACNGERRLSICIQLGGIEHHPHGAWKPTDDGTLRDVGNLLQIVLNLVGDGAQLVAVVVLAPQGQRENRHIVDGTRLDDRLRHARRNLIEVRIELAVDLDECVFLGRADQETHNHQAHSRARSGVDVFDPGDLVHEPLDGQSDAFLHLRGRGSRHGCGDVQHRHQDLRIFLARDDGDREDSERQRGHHKERRQLGVEKGVRQTSGHAQAGRTGILHG